MANYITGNSKRPPNGQLKESIPNLESQIFNWGFVLNRVLEISKS